MRQRYALASVLSEWDALFDAVRGAAMSARPLRVLHVITGLGQGGAESVLFRLATMPASRWSMSSSP